MRVEAQSSMPTAGRPGQPHLGRRQAAPLAQRLACPRPENGGPAAALVRRLRPIRGARIHTTVTCVALRMLRAMLRMVAFTEEILILTLTRKLVSTNAGTPG